MSDYYAQGMEGRAGWHQNFAMQIPTFQAKYNLTNAQVAQILADAAWVVYWVQARVQADMLMQQLTKYFNGIAGSDPSIDPPAPILFALNGEAPAEVPPGIEFRVREIARHIKGHASYNNADGELLGIVADESDAMDLTEAVPTINVRAMPGFKLEATFTKNGADAMRFEIRHKGGEWQQAAFLMSSPGEFSVTPAVPGVAEQIEVRAVSVKKNEDVGMFSQTATAFVAA
jgi:hypothetical protein